MCGCVRNLRKLTFNMLQNNQKLFYNHHVINDLSQISPLCNTKYAVHIRKTKCIYIHTHVECIALERLGRVCSPSGRKPVYLPFAILNFQGVCAALDPATPLLYTSSTILRRSRLSELAGPEPDSWQPMVDIGVRMG